MNKIEGFGLLLQNSGGELLDILRAHAARADGRVAALTKADGATLGFDGLSAAADRLRKRLLGLHIAAGDVVAVMVADDTPFVPLLAACAALGAVLLPVRRATPAADLREILAHSRPRLLIETDLMVWLAASGNGGERGETEWGQVDGSDDAAPCLILRTSGNGGPAKPALLAMRNLIAMARAFLTVHDLGAGDVILAQSPCSTAGGASLCGIIPAVAGASVVAPRPFASAAEFWRCVRDKRVTICETTPGRLEWLLASIRPHNDVVPDHLRWFVCTPGPLPQGLRAAFQQAFGIPVHNGYGMPETTLWAACSRPGEAASGGGRGFQPIEGCEIAIRPLRGGVAAPPWPERGGPAPGSAAGEILVRGPNVSSGYHKRPSLTNSAFEEGWFRTGDLGWFDENGALVVRARLKELASRDRVAIALADIDAQLGAHPDLVESKTVLAPRPASRQRIVSVCVPRGDPTDEQGAAAAQWLRARHGGTPQPDEVICAAALPRGPAGQVSAHALTRMITGALRDDIVDALSGRKFRRDPPYDLDGLRDRVQASIMMAAPLDFVMLWGCGGRDAVAATERAALANIGELLAETTPLGHMRSRAHIIFTDLHAASNGHSEAHYLAYFKNVSAAASDLGASFLLESELWAGGGLTSAQVRRFEDSREFDTYWNNFPLREKFVDQAARHSKKPDPVAAARHYLATCRMERDLVSRRFPQGVFLTYNSPDYNECFPDLPTLYIYPGPRGRTVKPWFSVVGAVA